MARKTWQNYKPPIINGQQKVPIPIDWQKAERALIRTKIINRDPLVGKTDYSKIIPREWSGRYYFYKDNYQLSNGELEYKSQIIYADEYFWKAENITQQMAQRVPLIEVTQPEENAEEISELLIFSGNLLSNLIDNLNIPLIGDIAQFIVNFFDNLSSDDLYYFPAPFRPDHLYISVPVGLVALEVEFLWWAYSPIAFGGGIAEVDIKDLQQLPNLPDADNPETASPLLNFDALARQQGYIKASECAKRFTNQWIISATASFVEAGQTYNYPLKYIIESSTQPSVTASISSPRPLLVGDIPAASIVCGSVVSYQPFPPSPLWVQVAVVTINGLDYLGGAGAFSGGISSFSLIDLTITRCSS